MAASWDQMTSWQLVLPPNRPGTSVLTIIAQALRGSRPIRHAAVLGSTPEYVDLLHEHEVQQVTLLDSSPHFADEVRSLRRFPATEEILVGDWRTTLAGCEGRFDLVLSDFTLGNLPYHDQGELLGLVAGSLSRDGRFIDRVLTYRRPCHDYGALRRRFRAQPANLITLNDFNAAWLFCGQRVERDAVVDTAATYKWGRDEYGESELGWLLANCARISPTGMIWHYGKPWRELRPVYEKHLRLRCEWPEPAGSAYRGWAFVRDSEQQRPRASARGINR